MSSLTKADLVNHLVTSHDGMTRRQAGAIIDGIFHPRDGVIARTVRKGGVVRLPGFGSFQRAQRKARKGRNPATGEAIKVGASKTVRFKVAAALKTAVNGR